MRLGIRKAVMAVLVNSENKVLIGSSPRDGGYKFPQGGLDPDEDVLEGLKRELLEELGLFITEDDIVATHTKKVSYNFPDDGYYIYDSQELHVIQIKYHSKMTLIPQDDEFDELIWIHPKELSTYDCQFRMGAYKQALELCRLL